VKTTGRVQDLGRLLAASFVALSAEEKAAVRQEILDRLLVARPCSSTVQ
jgi:hypothetical protein